jgi:WD40 repeat protein
MPPLSEPDLRAAVVEPAAARGVAVDDALVDMVLAEIGHGSAAQPNALPLLSHALLSAWEHRSGARLTAADYRAVGGLRGAVQQSAEVAYGELLPPQRELARRMFLRLVTVDEDVMTTKRRMERTELPAGDVAEVLEGFVARRLITVGERYVEISHDALLTAWPRLAEWAAADQAGLLVHRRLTRAAKEWQAGGSDRHLLLRGTPLATAEEWAADPDHAAAMNRIERAFLAAGVSAREAEHRAARRRFTVLRGLVAALAVALLIAVFSAVHAVRAGDDAAGQRREAEHARDQALSREVAIEATRAAATDTALAQQLALAAYRIAPTVDARSALLDTTVPGVVDRRVGAPGPTAMRLDPTGSVLAVGNAGTGEVALYHYGGDRIGARLGTVPTAHDQVFALAFSPDGRTLAVGGSNGTVRLAAVADPARTRALGDAPGRDGAVEALAFSPDGRTLVAAGAHPALRAWHGSAAVPITGTAAGEVEQAVAFSPDGRTLVAGGSTGVLHRWSSGRLNAAPAAVRLGGSTIDLAVFAPGGSAVLTGAKDGSAEVVPAHGAPRPLATGFSSWVNAGAYAPDGRHLAVGGSNGTIDVFDARTGARQAVITGSDKVTGLAYSPDGQVLLAAGADGTVRGYPVPAPVPAGGPVFGLSYDRTGDRLAAASSGPGGAVTVSPSPGRVAAPAWFGPADGTTALSPDGRLVVAGNHAGKVMLAGAGAPVALTGATSVIESLAFGPGGRTVAAASDDGFVHLWDVSDPSRPVTLPKLASGGEAASVAFSPDGHYLAAASVDRTVHLWEVTDPRAARPLATAGGFRDYAWSVAFSPDSRLLVAGGADDTVRLWSITDPRRPVPVSGPLTGPTHYIYSVALSPDGQSLAAAGGDGSVWTWRLGTGAPEVMTALHAADPGGQVYAVAYRPGGGTLTAAGSDGRVVTWNADADAVAAEICRSGGDNLTRDEWARYLPGAAPRETCG